MASRLPAAFAVLLLLCSSTSAQVQRFELGRRLRAFETAWEASKDPKSDARCVEPLNNAVAAFFSFRLADAGRSIDESMLAVRGTAAPTALERYAQSLALSPAKRLLDSSEKALPLELKPFYPVKRPKEAHLTFEAALVEGSARKAQLSTSVEQTPLATSLAIPSPLEGDFELQYRILQDGKPVASGSMTISFAKNLAGRLAALKKAESPDTVNIEAATARSLGDLLSRLASGTTEETDYPAARLLREAEAAAEAGQKGVALYDHHRTGEHWLSLTGGEAGSDSAWTSPVRIRVPEKFDPKNPPPLVVALHGAGSSENMFFDSYGAGKVVRLSAERGWMLLSPRVGFGFRLGPILDALHQRYPFDPKRVFLIGHSMGAAAATREACAEPERYAGVVALGGSGTTKANDAFRRIPFFVGVGLKDFALNGARSLRDRLTKAGVLKVVYRELSNVEHLGIVQRTLDEAFAFLEQAGGAGNEPKSVEVWPQWRGPTRDGIVGGEPWPDRIRGDAFRTVWKKEKLGPSYSGPIVSADTVFTTETVKRESEVVTAYDRKTGAEKWRTKWQGAMSVPFFAASNGSWIRSTPAYDGENLYVAGMRDVLVCLDAKTGAERWRVDFIKDQGGELPAFGLVCSPLVDAGFVYVQAGGAFVKLDGKSGRIVWKALSEGGGMMGGAFSSPTFATIAGKRQILVQTRKTLAGVDAEKGEVIWSRDVPSFRGMNILTPVAFGDGVFTSTYQNKSWLFSVASKDAAFTVGEAWSNDVKAYMSTPVVVDGHAYMHLQNQRFACVDLKTGERKWTSKPYGKYWSLVANRDRLLALDERGSLLLIRANPKEFTLIDERKVSDQECWAHLAVCGRQIFVRSLDALEVFDWQGAGRPAAK